MTNPRVFHTKVTLCGEVGCGKTSIRRNYMGLSFLREHVSTLGADFSLKKTPVFSDQVDLQIWDLGGQEGYEALRSRYFSGSKGALMVFDLTNPDTLSALEKWFIELWDCVNKQRTPAVILGNKCDLVDEIAVTEEDVHNFVKELKARHEIEELDYIYFQTSAKDGINIDDAFYELAKQMYFILCEDLNLEPSTEAEQ